MNAVNSRTQKGKKKKDYYVGDWKDHLGKTMEL